MITRAAKLISLYARVNIQNLAAYRFDMYMRIVVSILHLISELMGVWIIFHGTRSVRGWQWQHMLVLVGVYRLVAGGIRIAIVPNMRRLLEDIRNGTLDFVLLRPVNSQFLVSIREVVVYRVADVLLGIFVAGYGCYALRGALPFRESVEFALMLAAGFAIVYAVWLMLGTLCFWFVRVQNIEMVFWNVFEAGRFPIDIYRPQVRWLLTYVIPLAFITTVPAAALIGDEAKIPPSAPLWGFALAGIMLFVSNRFWHFGLRHYSGASA
ncbi:MAG: multidrug transporter [Planctomycetota bacterium]|nr:MAG: multidrug transporter [Planctomycetota bacterium]